MQTPEADPPVESEVVDSVAEAEPPVEDISPKWEHRTEFKITKEMRGAIKQTIDATNLEVAALRRKLQKLQYGG